MSAARAAVARLPGWLGLDLPRLRRTRSRGRARSRRTALTARGRRLALIVACAVPLLAGGYVWLRDSSLVRVEHVAVSGLHGADSPAIRAALRAAAGDMTTMHVRIDELRNATGPFPVVKDLRVTTQFPHGLYIRVIQYHPVAAVTIDNARVPVAADGTVLNGELASGSLTTVDATGGSAGGRLTDPRALHAVALLGAAPAPLRALIDAVVPDSEGGLQARLQAGPTIEFGAATQLRAKWDAAARVLNDARSHGASYLDVRVPARPVAGRFPGDPSPAPAASYAPSSASATGAAGTTATSTDSQTGTAAGGLAP
ncbi:MAG TPA: FtsQ-type POTRA domain-containing protein [Solirubrobacteraceae bacterium]